MPFHCPQCAQPALEITSIMDLPADSRSDDIAVQIVQCAECRFIGIAVYEESRRGAPGYAAIDHCGYRVTDADLTLLLDALRTCPTPRQENCACAAHQWLGRQGGRGRWSGLDEIDLQARFAMEFA